MHRAPREERVVDPFEVADAGPRLKLLRDAQQFRLSFIILSGTLICFGPFLVATYFRYPAHYISLSHALSQLWVFLLSVFMADSDRLPLGPAF